MRIDKYVHQKEETNRLILKMLKNYPLIPNTRNPEKMAEYNLINHRIYEICHPFIAKTVNSMIGITQDMKEDCISESYAWMVRAIPAFVGSGNPNFTNYIIRTVKNHCIRYYKHNKNSYFSRRETVVPFKSDDYDLSDVIGCNDRDPYSTLKLRINSRFHGEDLSFLKELVSDIDNPVNFTNLVTISKHKKLKGTKYQFLAKWLLFKLKEIATKEGYL